VRVQFKKGKGRHSLSWLAALLDLPTKRKKERKRDGWKARRRGIRLYVKEITFLFNRRSLSSMGLVQGGCYPP